jgi:hypothetical protein
MTPLQKANSSSTKNNQDIFGAGKIFIFLPHLGQRFRINLNIIPN